jgi:dihydrofolate reductase
VSKLRVHNFAISLDGYGAGPNQDMENPLGRGGLALHEWVLATRTFRKLFGDGQGTTGIDDDFVARGFENIGAWILGRNMFGPVRGSWPDDQWEGWWGDNPPYHTVFVLTNHPLAPIVMDGGTTFHFVTDGLHAALQLAASAAKGQDIRLGGGVATIQQVSSGRTRGRNARRRCAGSLWVREKTCLQASTWSSSATRSWNMLLRRTLPTRFSKKSNDSAAVPAVQLVVVLNMNLVWLFFHGQRCRRFRVRQA